MQFGGKSPEVDKIRPKYASLDVVGLSWLTHLCSVAWRLGTVPMDRQTRVVVPLFKKGDRRVCSNYRGVTLFTLPGKVYVRVLERRIRPIVKRNNAVFCSSKMSVETCINLLMLRESNRLFFLKR